MAFIYLKTDDNQDYLCSTSNVAGINAYDDIYLTLQKGPRLLGRPGEMRLQDEFRIKSARPDAVLLAAEIAIAEKNGEILDLRERCILTDRGPARR